MKLSIITINYNNASGLKRTIESVGAQNYNDFEYIVIDGGSNDGSDTIIKQYEANINYWISEKDKGIYNAMNKGIEAAQGEYLLFLNSGDVLMNSSIINTVSSELCDFDIVYGDGALNGTNATTVVMKIPEALNMQYFSRSSLFHPSTFIKKELFTKYGLYDESNKIVSDWDFFIKTIIVNKVTAKKTDHVISKIEDGGISRDPLNTALLNDEISKTLNKYFSKQELNALNQNQRSSKENFKKKENVVSKIFKKIKKTFS